MLFPRHRCFVLLRDHVPYILCLVTIFTAIGAILALLLCGIESTETSDGVTETGQIVKSAMVLQNALTMNLERRGEVCEPLPPTDDDAKCGNRVADRKCCEYRRAMNNKDEIMKNYRRHGLFTIIGGKNAEPGAFPHMAAVGWLYRKKRNKYVFLCGGSLISNKFVLTAAHCTNYTGTKDLDPTPQIVRMGSEHISDNIKDRERKNVKIKNIIIHHNYSREFYYYDIALLELRSEVIFTRKIHPACLSTSLSPTHFTEVNITGWGSTDKDGTQMSEHLQVATVNMIKYKTCERKLVQEQNGNWVFRTHQLCAGVKDGGIDTCQGDSGGPLQVQVCTTSGSMHTVIGVTSAGRRCGSPDSPGIYISVVSVLTWIENIVWPEEYEKLRGFKRSY